MIELLVIAVFIILVSPIFRESRFKKIERHQAMRRALTKLQEKYRHYSL